MPAKSIQLTLFNVYLNDSYILCKVLLSILDAQILPILLLAGISLYQETKNMQGIIKKQLIQIFLPKQEFKIAKKIQKSI